MPDGRNKPAVNRIALEGKTFERLTVLGPVRVPGEALRYECRCVCGNTTTVRAQNLRVGMTKSCGCLHREISKAVNSRHGLSKTRIHNIWSGMIQRCEDPGCVAYPDYGGRGITVCPEWHIFENFLADMGQPPPGMTLDRKENSEGYSKANCRWATRTAQANNRRSNKLIEFAGRTQTQREWEKEAGLRRGQLYERLERGWTLERALTSSPAISLGNSEGIA